ncbi:MAG: hypothetical protein M3N14_09980 [Bacteroidota bacterium]|nr:hypothetical protein [Bacteroidota bacterium]
MKNTTLLCLIIITLAVTVNSCITQQFISPTFKPESAATIAKLPESEKVQGKEIMDWYTANLQFAALEPHWDKPMQTVFNKHHVMMVFVSADAALFFTKINGVLKVDAYRWQDKNPGARLFTGNIIDYSFQTNKLSALVYYNSELVQNGTKQLPPIPVVEFINKIMLSDIWSWIKSYKNER